MFNFSLRDIILCGAAHHKQYPDEKIVLQTDDREYEKHKQMAEREGFSINNPTLFFINHVYSSNSKIHY